MLRAAIRQTLFHQNVLRENSPKFNDVKVSQYMVHNKFSFKPSCMCNTYNNQLWVSILKTLHIISLYLVTGTTAHRWNSYSHLQSCFK